MRLALLALLLAVGIMAGSAETVPAQTPPRLDGAYLYLPHLQEAEVGPLLDEWRALGMTTIVTSEARLKLDCAAPSYQWMGGAPDRIGQVLSAASTRGMTVYVGLVFSQGQCPIPYDEPTVTHDADETVAIVDTVISRWGMQASLAGWSIVNEPALAWEARPEILPKRDAYYRRQVEAIRSRSALPVLTAPYLAGAFRASDGTVHSPTRVANDAAAFLAATGLTTLVWQDSVQVEPMPPFAWQRTPYTVGQYYAALVSRLGAAATWSDLELGDCCALTGEGYSPTAGTRLRGQLAAAAATGERLSWLPQRQMTAADDARHPDAPRLLDAYRAAIGLSGRLLPFTYTWGTPPAAQYPDTGGRELRDSETGDPYGYADPRWAGVHGRTEFTIDLGSRQAVRWITVHGLAKPAYGIGRPSAMTVQCAQTANAWSALGTWSYSFPDVDGEYTLSPSAPLSASCRWLRLTLTSGRWVFLSDVEVVSP